MSMGVYGFSGVCGFLWVFMSFYSEEFKDVFGRLWVFLDF